MTPYSIVVPAKAGIQLPFEAPKLDPDLRQDDAWLQMTGSSSAMTPCSIVIPAKAGIQLPFEAPKLDPDLRQDDAWLQMSGSSPAVTREGN